MPAAWIVPLSLLFQLTNQPSRHILMKPSWSTSTGAWSSRMLVLRSLIHRETGAARLRKQRESPRAWGVRVLVLAMSREPDRRIGSKGRDGERPSIQRAPAAGAADAENTKSPKAENHDAALPGHPDTPCLSLSGLLAALSTKALPVLRYGARLLLGQLYRHRRRL
jgi:hypothetical protein